jgi:hypothetical protein
MCFSDGFCLFVRLVRALVSGDGLHLSSLAMLRFFFFFVDSAFNDYEVSGESPGIVATIA